MSHRENSNMTPLGENQYLQTLGAEQLDMGGAFSQPS